MLGEVLRHLEACYPEEGCGVVLQGPAGARWVPLANAYAAWAGQGRGRVSSECAVCVSLRANRPGSRSCARPTGRQERVAYVVHSHPDGQAAFSAEDVAQAAPEGLPLLPGVATSWWPSRRAAPPRPVVRGGSRAAFRKCRYPCKVRYLS